MIQAEPGDASSAGAINGIPTTRDGKTGANATVGCVQLLVLEAGGLAVYPLPDSGTISIGRAEDCDVQLRDPLASRRHAKLHLVPLGIADSGSANGTLLGGCALEPDQRVPIQIGQAVCIGSSLLIVRAGAADLPAAKPNGKSATRIAAARPRVVCQPAMKELYALVNRLAQGSINVLILGETGVGKELVAESIHRASPRSDAPFVRINCAALVEPLLESELFGHERGAFTGAVSAKPGLIELADRGTVLLDEVGELSPALQAKLLRVIEEQEVKRVGGVRSRPINVRFVSATNRDVEVEVARGALRADLMFRLNGASVHVPPLRERPLEIIPLADAFLGRMAAQMNLTRPPRLSEKAVALLLADPWPGNVRELRNVIERAVLLCPGASIAPEDLALGRRSSSSRPSADEPSPSGPWTQIPRAGAADLAAQAEARSPIEAGDGVAAHQLADSERDRIAQALLECGGNQSRAAKFLSIPRRTLVRKIAQLGLPRPRGSNE